MKKMKVLEEFLITSHQNVRSTERTVRLHCCVLEWLKSNYPKFKLYDWEFEYSISGDGYGGSFKIDIVGLNNDIPKIAVLVKCPNTNIGKNLKNYANTQCGESGRIRYWKEGVINEIFFVTIFPSIDPVFTSNGEWKNGDLLRMMKHTNPTRVIKGDASGTNTKVELIDICYDIGDLSQKRTRDDFKIIKPVNIRIL